MRWIKLTGEEDFGIVDAKYNYFKKSIKKLRKILEQHKRPKNKPSPCPWFPPQIPNKPKYIVLDIETTGLLPWYGNRITCICAKDSDGKRFGMVDKDEIEIISFLVDWLRKRKQSKYLIVTKNGKGFDIPFVLARLALQCRINTEESGDFFMFILLFLSYDHFDLQEITRKRISLESMAELLGCTPKSGDGKNAIKLWNEGRYDELKEYCAQDIDTTEEVFLKWKSLRIK